HSVRARSRHSVRARSRHSVRARSRRSHLEELRVAPGGALERGPDELVEQRVRAVGPALELRMRLRGDPARVTRKLDELDQAIVGRRARTDQPGVLEPVAVTGVDLVTVAMALVDDLVAVGLA